MSNKIHKIHVFLGNKGGNGKSFAAYIYAQYLLKNGAAVTLFDNDAGNKTLFNCDGLTVTPLPLEARAGGKLRAEDTQKFSDRLASAHEAGTVIIDSGAAQSYRNICDMLEEDYGDDPALSLHTTVSPRALDENRRVCAQLRQRFPQAALYAWFSPYLGDFPAAVTDDPAGWLGVDGVHVIMLPDIKDGLNGWIVTSAYNNDASYTFERFIEMADRTALGRALTVTEQKRVRKVAEQHYAAVAAGGL